MVFKLSNLQISEAAQNLKIHSFSSAKLVQHPPSPQRTGSKQHKTGLLHPHGLIQELVWQHVLPGLRVRASGFMDYPLQWLRADCTR
jgi:hypothetical protein